MLPALKLSQHWRGSEHTPVCKAARDTWPMPLPGSQQCSLAAGSLPGLFSRLCPETQSSQKPAGAMLRQGARQGVFSERAVRCWGGPAGHSSSAPPSRPRGRSAQSSAPQDSPPLGRRKGAAGNSVQWARFTDSWCTSCGRREDGMSLGRTKSG